MKLHSTLPIVCIVMFCHIVLVLSCSMGGSAEQGNAKISGAVVRKQGCDSAVTVQLVTEDFNPFKRSSGTVLSTTTDNAGIFLFEFVPSGVYYLYAFNGDTSCSFLNGPFTVGDGGEETRNGSLSEVSIITIADSDPRSDSAACYFVKGTSHQTLTIDSIRSQVVLQGVPAGNLDVMQCRAGGPSLLQTELYSGAVEVRPGDSLSVSRSNRPPRITSATTLLPQTVYLDSTYIISVAAEDPDSDAITCELQTPLYASTLDTTRRELIWTPVQSEISLTQIVLKVSDNRGAFSIFRWKFGVMRGTTAPSSAAPDGNFSCFPGTLTEFSTTPADCYTSIAQYRFSWGDGDTSAWSGSSTASHAWPLTGTYAVRVQVLCSDYYYPSAWSAAREVVVENGPKTETPELKVPTISVVLHDTLVDVTYDSATSTLVPAPGNFIVNDTIPLIAWAAACKGPLVYNYYVNGKSIAGWTAAAAYTFHPEVDGIHEFRVAAWCDTASSSPSEMSMPCTVMVEPEQIRAPVLDGNLSADMRDTVYFKFILSGSTSYHDQPLYYRYQLMMKTAAATPGAILANLLLNPSNTGASSHDTISITTFNVATGWYRGTLLYLDLYYPEQGNYTFAVQAGIVDGLQTSAWQYFTLTIR